MSVRVNHRYDVTGDGACNTPLVAVTLATGTPSVMPLRLSDGGMTCTSVQYINLTHRSTLYKYFRLPRDTVRPVGAVLE